PSAIRSSRACWPRAPVSTPCSSVCPPPKNARSGHERRTAARRRSHRSAQHGGVSNLRRTAARRRSHRSAQHGGFPVNKPGHKQIEVQIMGQSYLLSCPVGGESLLLEAVERVDTAMCRIRDAGKVKARDRIAVLASLN